MNNVSRRSFVQGAAMGAAAAGIAAGAVSAFAEETPAAGEAMAAADYLNIYADGANLMPARKAACPGPRGPVAFESRQIGEDEIVRVEETDVVIAGAGVGGLVAGLKAADMGANVLILEKMTKGRGCFECFGAVNAKCQEGTEIDKIALFDELQRSAYWRCRPEPAHTYCDRSGEATDFWQEMLDKGQNGFVITKVEQEPSTCGFPAMTPLIDTELGFYSSPCLPESAGWRSGLSGIYVCLEMQEVAKSAYSNVEMRFSNPVVQLIKEDGRVTGVIAKDAEGYYRVNASKGVIVATGGYDCNPEMMQAWTRPEDYANSSWWNPGWGTTGDGHMMGLAVGAGMDPIPQPVMNFRWGNPDSFDDYRTWNAVYFGILVNGNGKRFVREDLPFHAVSNAQNAQPGYGKNCWYIFDECMADGMLDDETQAEFKGKGWLYEAATAEELGELVGFDGARLAQTIADYNAGFVGGPFEGGVDAELGRDLAGTMPFMGERLFAFVSNSNVLATVGGLTINGECCVLDQADCPIPGLYACGNASGNFFAGNYPRHIPGTSIGRAVTFGYVAAESCVNGVTGERPILDGNVDLTPYAEGAAVDEATLEAAKELGAWNPYDPMHGGSDLYTAEQLGGNVTACDNCHTYRPGDATVADGMIMQ